MPALKKDPSPGGPTTDGSTIYTDQWNNIVDRVGGEANLIANRAIATDANGNLEVQAVTKTELGYLSGCLSNIQTQLNGKAASSHTHVKADVTDFAHTHPESDITNLVTDLAAKEATANKGVANGYCELGTDSKVPASRLTEKIGLTDLTDVVITTPASGHYVKHNGTNFVNSAIQSGDLPSHNHNASDINAGTLEDARLSANVVLENQTNDFAAAQDFDEVSAPSAPGANKVRLFAQDRSGFSELVYKDDAGRIVYLSSIDREARRKPVGVVIGGNSSALTVHNINTPSANGTVTQTTDADGYYRNYASAATTNSDAGLIPASGWVGLRRAWNFDLTFKFKLDETASRRAWIGVAAGSLSAADAPTAAHVALRVSSSAGVTNFTVSRSDGTTQAETDLGIAADTSVHTFRIIADDASSRIGYSLDGAAVTWVSNNIPAASADLNILAAVRTLENVAKNIKVYIAYGIQDK